MNGQLIESAADVVGDDGYKKRSQMYVKHQFQQSLMLQVLLVTFIIINVIVMAIYWMMDFISDLQQMKEYLAYTVAGMELVAFFVIYKLNLESSHRIAGPIYKLELNLRSIEKGNLDGEMKLRKNDHFPEMAVQVNATVNALRVRINNAQYITQQIKNNPEKAEQLVEQLEHELDFFRT